MNLRDTIKLYTNQHLNDGYLVMGQCLTAVGWVGGTLPERDDMTEFPMSDVAQSGFVVGAALAGRRPIYVVRYQGFQHFNAPLLVNYAAKSKEIWGRPCPLLIRSIAMEGKIGPTTGSSHHSMFTRMPGIKVIAPMTSNEWFSAYAKFMASDDVVYLSEHRKAYDNADELEHIQYEHPDVVLFPISVTRFAAMEASQELAASDNLRVSVLHVVELKPFDVHRAMADELLKARCGIVLDDDFENGVAKTIAHDLHNATGQPMHVLGLADRTAGFGEGLDNLPPDKERIKQRILEVV